MRTIVELPEEQVRALDAWRQTRGISRAEAVRRAVARLLEEESQRHEAVKSAFGLWADRAIDGLARQEQLRAEWNDR